MTPAGARSDPVLRTRSLTKRYRSGIAVENFQIILQRAIGIAAAQKKRGLSQKQAGVGELYLARLLIIHRRRSRISRIEARVCEQNIVIEIAFVNFASPFEELYRRRKIPAREHF